MSTYIVGYDISDPGRLQRVHRAMLRFAAPIEYSIFLLDGNEKEMQTCMNTVLLLMDKHVDDVRCYPLPVRGLQTRLGRVCLPLGIIWTGMPTACC